MKNEEQVWELVENKKEEFINFSDRIFDTPEILYQEFKSVSEHNKMLTFYFDQNWLEAQKKLKDCENLLNGVMKEYYNMMNFALLFYLYHTT